MNVSLVYNPETGEKKILSDTELSTGQVGCLLNNFTTALIYGNCEVVILETKPIETESLENTETETE